MVDDLAASLCASIRRVSAAVAGLATIPSAVQVDRGIADLVGVAVTVRTQRSCSTRNILSCVGVSAGTWPRPFGGRPGNGGSIERD
jgi:hypothetical protein